MPFDQGYLRFFLPSNLETKQAAYVVVAFVFSGRTDFHFQNDLQEPL